MQNAGFPNKRNGKLLRSRDGNQLVVKNTGEGEQIVALVLQRDARAGRPCKLADGFQFVVGTGAHDPLALAPPR